MVAKSILGVLWLKRRAHEDKSICSFGEVVLFEDSRHTASIIAIPTKFLFRVVFLLCLLSAGRQIVSHVALKTTDP